MGQIAITQNGDRLHQTCNFRLLIGRKLASPSFVQANIIGPFEVARAAAVNKMVDLIGGTQQGGVKFEIQELHDPPQISFRVRGQVFVKNRQGPRALRSGKSKNPIKPLAMFFDLVLQAFSNTPARTDHSPAIPDQKDVSHTGSPPPARPFSGQAFGKIQHDICPRDPGDSLIKFGSKTTVFIPDFGQHRKDGFPESALVHPLSASANAAGCQSPIGPHHFAHAEYPGMHVQKPSEQSGSTTGDPQHKDKTEPR